ncbi:ribonuclease H [Senna tora]|uniref:Ribonuclease H n=1 Tax=Senna tora TaxID=362788 RepID=A0A834WZB4_9FABA|nr:ribonuclease H [Senna tora]
MLRQLNRSYIFLISKSNGPQSFKDFRPVNLANVSYKLMSKILCNHLKKILVDVIAPNQSAFLEGRNISDNVVLMSEIAHKVKSIRKGNTKWCVFNMDIQKAYDKLSWSFIETVLRKMHFPSRWIQLIMQCIMTVSYNLLISGNLTVDFQPSCGIRQGDPISTYLYILCANVLSCLIKKEVEAKLWRGIKIGRGAVEISHLIPNTPRRLKRSVEKTFGVKFAGCIDKPKAHLQGWKDLCLPKSNGGLALRDVYSLNMALIAKHIWKLISPSHNSFSTSVLGSKYMNSQVSGILRNHSNASWIWKGVPDKLYWSISKYGDYRVKDGFNYLIAKEFEMRGQTIRQRDNSNELWEFI